MDIQGSRHRNKNFQTGAENPYFLSFTVRSAFSFALCDMQIIFDSCPLNLIKIASSCNDVRDKVYICFQKKKKI